MPRRSVKIRVNHSIIWLLSIIAESILIISVHFHYSIEIIQSADRVLFYLIIDKRLWTRNYVVKFYFHEVIYHFLKFKYTPDDIHIYDIYIYIYVYILTIRRKHLSWRLNLFIPEHVPPHKYLAGTIKIYPIRYAYNLALLTLAFIRFRWVCVFYWSVLFWGLTGNRETMHFSRCPSSHLTALGKSVV